MAASMTKKPREQAMRFHRLPCKLRWITAVSLILALAKPASDAQEPDQGIGNDAEMMSVESSRTAISLRG